MATDAAQELQQFHQFIGQRIASGSEMSIAEAVAEFQAYQAELERFREEIKPGLDRLARGEYEELDIEEFKRLARERWDKRRRGDQA
ncbi:hypothetical protein M4951_01320 [Blastopirellula sp. J2-11]|uniref:hypothetical protein n=1 Tax=Blastopirellula sp. J2-11 TaxID=2943192 RepID=UPI0021C7869D|nr:hypothetical protein [Blastopirellula sp. J2-11]UUO06965.1 hypothetical protein M4951_01320 [Blastopirellula sp. J2-11]